MTGGVVFNISMREGITRKDSLASSAKDPDKFLYMDLQNLFVIPISRQFEKAPKLVLFLNPEP